MGVVVFISLPLSLSEKGKQKSGFAALFLYKKPYFKLFFAFKVKPVVGGNAEAQRHVFEVDISWV